MYGTGSSYTRARALVPSPYPEKRLMLKPTGEKRRGAFYGQENICLAMKRTLPCLFLLISASNDFHRMEMGRVCVCVFVTGASFIHVMHNTATLEDDV